MAAIRVQAMATTAVAIVAGTVAGATAVAVVAGTVAGSTAVAAAELEPR